MEFRIGCSGWSYRHWRERFYPPGVPSTRWLDYYATVFDTVELNSTFYRLASERALEAWRERTPEHFRFAAKASRLITHNKRLANTDELLENYLERMRLLAERLGPVLYQLPPTFSRDDDRLAAFLSRLPRDVLHVFEFRNESWWHDDVYDVLRRHGAGFCIYNMGRETTPVVATCAEAYVRFHGPSAKFASGYSIRQLESWAQELDALQGVTRVWSFFNNDVDGHAPHDALALKRIVGHASGPAP